jgi:hypothetical protein
MMKLLIAISLPLLAAASPVDGSAALAERQSPVLNATVEYITQCKTCPWDLCNNVVPISRDQVVNVTCWTEGSKIDDNNLWLKTGDECYIAEYDFIETNTDYRTKIPYCGSIPEDITRQAATVRYLTTCNWERNVRGGDITHYGRDEEVTLTCFTEGGSVVGNNRWYKTTDNCHITEESLWGKPDGGLDDCGVPPGVHPNVSRPFRRSADATPPTLLEDVDRRDAGLDERDAEPDEPHQESSLGKRWLIASKIGEEYAPCYTCPSATENSTCEVQQVYEFSDRVVTQCHTREEVTYPNGTMDVFWWQLTTDWCYVESFYFWDPTWFITRYSECSLWGY